jgi:hypothetical protein
MSKRTRPFEDIFSEPRSKSTKLNIKLDVINFQLSAIEGKVTTLEYALTDINNKITINAGCNYYPPRDDLH